MYCKKRSFLYARWRRTLAHRISSKHVRATWYDRKPQEILDWHEHHDLSFCFVIKGNYKETTRRRTVMCRPGDVVIKGANLRHLNQFGDGGAVCLLLEISNELIENAGGQMEPSLGGIVRDHRLVRIGLELREELQISDRLSPAMIEGVAFRALVSVIRSEGEKSKQQAKVKVMRELLDAGERVDDLMRRYLKPSERKAARRLFSAAEGCSVHAYSLRRRALQAFDELLNTDQSLTEIALRTGFYDQAHFTRVFAGLFGVTPGRLRSRFN